jgi:hypothetical protein
VPFDPFAMAALLDERLADAGVEVLLGTMVVEAECEGNRITRLILANKEGLTAVEPVAIVDATGDADIAARSGCQTVKGREDNEGLAPGSLEFHVDGVDQAALAAYIEANRSPRFKELIASLREQGSWPFPYDIFISVQLDRPGVMMINTPRICGVDGTDPRSLSDGLRRGRQEIQQLLPIMRRHFPGFAQARISAVATLFGVRETRRITGEMVLTVEDVLKGQAFPDTIGYSMYGWDLPDPKRPSYQPMAEGKRHPPGPTPIPYRILIPRPVINLICPGRAVSVERDVLGPLRVMAPVMAMGEAAGQAAAQVVQGIPSFAAVDTRRLRETLAGAGAIVDRP